MALGNFYAGENYVAAYQMSATPYVTSSSLTLGQTKQISFGNVTRFFEVKNLGVATDVIAVAFTQNGLLPANSNFFIVSGTQTFSSEIRTDRLFLSASSGNPSYSLLAGLTIIQAKDFCVLTGSNGLNGVG